MADKIYCAMLSTGVCDLPERVESLRARIIELEEALQPFADLGDVVLAEAPPDAVAAWSFESSDGPHMITLDTFRSARTALDRAGS